MSKVITIILYEFRHLARSPFKIVSILLFVGAAIYGLQSGYALLSRQQQELEGIKSKNENAVAEVLGWYSVGKKGPYEKPWVDITMPIWAAWYAPASALKEPSPMMPFSIGQAEQFGYYKQVTNWNATFDSDLSEEIANPERLSTATLDFSFVVLYLLPILAIILLFNIGGLERDLGFNRLVEVNHNAHGKWLLARFTSYFVLVAGLLLILMMAYALASGAVPAMTGIFFKLYLFVASYLFIWFAAFYFINLTGNGSSNQAMKMVSLWLLFCVIMPGAIHQLASIKYLRIT